VRIYNPYCRDGIVNAKCPATGTGFAFDRRAVQRRHHPREPPGRKSGGVQDGELFPIRFRPTRTAFRTKTQRSIFLKSPTCTNHTQEPAASLVPDNLSFLAQSANWLTRHPKVFVVSNTNVLSDSTVLSLRYGFSIFPDGRNCRGGSPHFEDVPATRRRYSRKDEKRRIQNNRLHYVPWGPRSASASPITA
jgi:hypothetical protein